MKLEELLDEQEIQDIYALDKDVREAIEEIAEKYSQNAQYSRDTARRLVNIAINTKDKDAVIEAAKAIMKYGGNSALAQGLETIGFNTKSKDKIIKAARIMSLDEIVDSVKNEIYIGHLVQIAAYTEDKDAVIEAAKTIMKYNSEEAWDIAYGLRDIAKIMKDKDAVIEAAKAIRKYEGEAAEDITQGLEIIGFNTKSKDKVIKAARIMSLDEIVDSSKNKNYTSSLVQIATYTEDKDAVIEAAKTARKYEENTAKEIAYELRYIAMDTKDKNRVIKAARIMSLDEIVDSSKNKNYPLGLTQIAGYTEDKDAVIEAAKTIRKYEGEAADDISYRLDIIAIDTKDKSTLITACRIANVVGAQVFDTLDSKDFLTIKNKKLDDLINSKESFDAVAAYIKSGYELPMPSKDNIINYKNTASEYISKAYNIKNSNLNTNQILMLFSVDKAKRKKLADLIDNSNEIGLKMYNIATEETKRLEVDDKLPYLSLIAVTGSRNKDMDNEAYKRISGIVGEKAVKRARNEFSSHYKNKIKEIAEYVKKNEINKAIDYLKSTKNEAIEDVLRCADYRDFSLTGGNTVLRAVESNNPLDYDNRVQIACVYLPSNYHNGIYNYCKDYYSRNKEKGFVLVRYDIGGRSLGSAICYMENDAFLVDSVEGHRTFRKPQIFKAVYQDLIDRAREKGAKKVTFSDKGINETPIKFMEFIGSLGPKRGNIKMKLDTKGYLEAKKDKVEGYIVDL